ncbi:hypothetical protein [Nesterenkonia cremea]|uniref:Uncharacterized protein n=1 Tax=Nesterenkonia cremea TaxID=1882340 RepID=A0A917EP50_9MICC|nr:hypothetical protein [Nesterenkonia cremea]GGE65495.1 hypothetical protein GCM10011401_10920 [Nesterenkonia cremea]
MKDLFRSPFPWLLLTAVASSLAFADRWPYVAVLLTALTAAVCGAGIHRSQQKPARA